MSKVPPPKEAEEAEKPALDRPVGHSYPFKPRSAQDTRSKGRRMASKVLNWTLSIMICLSLAAWGAIAMLTYLQKASA